MTKEVSRNRELIRFYKENPSMLSSPYTLHLELFKRFRKRLTPLGFQIFSKLKIRGTKIFDFGCGLGGFLAFAKINGAKLCVGRDQANYIVSDNAAYIDHLEIDTNLPINQLNNFYDLVICSEVLEHTGFKWKEIIGELIRITKRNGIIFISAPNYFNLCGIIKWIFEKSGYYKRNTWAPFQNYLPQVSEQPLKSYQILREIKKYAVKVIEKRSIWWIDSWAPWIHRHPEIKLYTGKLDFLRRHIDRIFSYWPYGGLQFYCILQKK